MATIDTKSVIDDLIANNGHFEGDWTSEGADEPVLSITEYTNMWGGTCWGICYPADPPDRYKATQAVLNPKVIFKHVPHADCNHPAGRQ